MNTHIQEDDQPRSKFLFFMFSLLILATCLSTKISSTGGLGVRPDDIILGIVVSIVIATEFNRKKIELPPREIILSLVFLVFAILLSTLVNSMTNYRLNSFSGVVHEISRIMKYLLILFVFCFAGKQNGMKERLVKALIVSALIVVAIGFMQLFDILGINRIISTYYKPESSALVTSDPAARLLGIQRIPSTFYSPNVLGMFLLIPLSISFSYALLKNRKGYIALTAIFFAGILITQSRTAIVCSVILFPVIWLLARKRTSRITNRWLFISVLTLLSLFFVGSFMFNQLNLIRATKISISDPSVNSRIEVLKKTVSDTLSHEPFLGFSQMSTPDWVLDNEYLWFFYFNGLLGICAYILFLYFLYRCLPKDLDPLNIAVASVFIVFLLANLSLTTFYSEKVYALFLMMYGLAISSESYESKRKHSLKGTYHKTKPIRATKWKYS